MTNIILNIICCYDYYCIFLLYPRRVLLFITKHAHSLLYIRHSMGHALFTGNISTYQIIIIIINIIIYMA